METPTVSTSLPTSPPNKSWGAIISIFLILTIVVAGAYYAFTDRVTPDALETTATY